MIVRAVACLALALATLPAGAQNGTAAAPQETDRLEIRPAAPPDPDRRRRLARWHESSVRRLEPIRRTARELARALTERPGSARELPRCRELGRMLARYHENPLPPAPEFAVAVHVRAALDHWLRAAVACLSERLTATPPELARAERALAQAALALRRWDLEP